VRESKALCLVSLRTFFWIALESRGFSVCICKATERRATSHDDMLYIKRRCDKIMNHIFCYYSRCLLGYTMSSSQDVNIINKRSSTKLASIVEQCNLNFMKEWLTSNVTFVQVFITWNGQSPLRASVPPTMRFLLSTVVGGTDLGPLPQVPFCLVSITALSLVTTWSATPSQQIP